MLSVALSFVMSGASGVHAIWERSSIDSVNSDFSEMRLVCLGTGDKTFDAVLDSGAGDHCLSLGAISASPSPPEYFVQEHLAANRSSCEFDSPLDDDPSLRRWTILSSMKMEKAVSGFCV